MKEYVFKAILNYQHHTFDYVSQRWQTSWKKQTSLATQNMPVGMMGLGKLGKTVARQLAHFGYQVFGWARHKKTIKDVDTFAGAGNLVPFLRQVKVLVCLLPLTEQTKGILNIDVFKKLKHPAYVINVARGEHLVEEDLLYALDKQWLAGACLDVFKEEPLQAKHPFWNRSNIIITPHVSSITRPQDAAVQLVENYKRLTSGQPLMHVVNRQRGY